MLNKGSAIQKETILLLPLIFVVLLIGMAPLGEALSTSFFHDINGKRTPAGWDNYRFIFTDRGFLLSLGITLFWATFNTAASLAIALPLAWHLNRKARFHSLLFPALAVPWGIPVYIAVPLWRAFFHGDGGKSLFSRISGIEINLLTDAGASFFSTAWVSVWLGIPFSVLVLWNHMRKIPRSLGEAAIMDGAPNRIILSRIYLPQISGAITAIVLINFIKYLKEFSVIYLMTSGGPPLVSGITEHFIIGGTTTLDILIHEIFSTRQDLGISSAYAVILGLLIFIILILRQHLIGRKKHLPKRQKRRNVLSSPISYEVIRLFFLFLFIVSALIILFLMLRLAFSRLGTCYIETPIPPFPTKDNFIDIFREETIHLSFLNSFWLALSTSLLAPVIILPGAFALQNFDKQKAFGILIILQILGLYGGMHSLIPLYSFFQRTGIHGSWLPLVLIYLNQSIPSGLFIAHTFVKKIPRSLKENARLEGCPPFLYLVKVIFPLSLPVVSTIMITAFLTAWNGFMAPLLFINEERFFTVGIKLFSLAGKLASGFPRWNLFAAGSTINCLILLGFFLAMKNPLRRTRLSEADFI